MTHNWVVTNHLIFTKEIIIIELISGRKKKTKKTSKSMTNEWKMKRYFSHSMRLSNQYGMNHITLNASFITQLQWKIYIQEKRPNKLHDFYK